MDHKELAHVCKEKLTSNLDSVFQVAACSHQAIKLNKILQVSNVIWLLTTLPDKEVIIIWERKLKFSSQRDRWSWASCGQDEELCSCGGLPRAGQQWHLRHRETPPELPVWMRVFSCQKGEGTPERGKCLCKGPEAERKAKEVNWRGGWRSNNEHGCRQFTNNGSVQIPGRDFLEKRRKRRSKRKASWWNNCSSSCIE